jgi:hypothetical protein
MIMTPPEAAPQRLEDFTPDIVGYGASMAIAHAAGAIDDEGLGNTCHTEIDPDPPAPVKSDAGIGALVRL